MKTIPTNVMREITERLQNEPKKVERKPKALYITLGWLIGLAALLTTLGACGLIPKY